jgi:hypothetical protein
MWAELNLTKKTDLSKLTFKTNFDTLSKLAEQTKYTYHTFFFEIIFIENFFTQFFFISHVIRLV